MHQASDITDQFVLADQCSIADRIDIWCQSILIKDVTGFQSSDYLDDMRQGGPRSCSTITLTVLAILVGQHARHRRFGLLAGTEAHNMDQMQ